MAASLRSDVSPPAALLVAQMEDEVERGYAISSGHVQGVDVVAG